MSVYIKKFKIIAYRGIHNLELNNLKNINILVGNNNSGKTSVLELLSTVGNPQDIGSWVLPSRTHNSINNGNSFFSGFYNMFPIDSEDKNIVYEYENSYGNMTEIKLTGELENTQIPETEMYRLNGLMKTGSSKEENIVDTVCLNLNTYINSEKKNQYSLYDFQTRISKFINKTPFFVSTNYVSPIDHASGMIFLDNVISNKHLYNQLLNILQEFDRNIINITTIREKKNMPQYAILSKEHDFAIPLNSYGDGMKKAILLLSAIVQSQNGILLLDEFETAIHTSAMDSVFTWLLQNALDMDVQIFLTSHSLEAIDKLLNLDRRILSNTNVYTLYNHEGVNYVRTLTGIDAINAKDILGVELRG